MGTKGIVVITAIAVPIVLTVLIVMAAAGADGEGRPTRVPLMDNGEPAEQCFRLISFFRRYAFVSRAVG